MKQYHPPLVDTTFCLVQVSNSILQYCITLTSFCIYYQHIMNAKKSIFGSQNKAEQTYSGLQLKEKLTPTQCNFIHNKN